MEEDVQKYGEILVINLVAPSGQRKNYTKPNEYGSRQFEKARFNTSYSTSRVWTSLRHQEKHKAVKRNWINTKWYPQAVERGLGNAMEFKFVAATNTILLQYNVARPRRSL